MAKTYEEVVLARLYTGMELRADELSIQYAMKYNPATDEVTCVVANTENAGEFANYATHYIEGEKGHYKAKFEFPTKL